MISTDQKKQAVKSAGERLARIEGWLRKLIVLALATAAMTSITASIALFGAFKYWQVTTAVVRFGEIHEDIQAKLEAIRRMSPAELKGFEGMSQADREAKLREMLKSH